MFINLTPKAIAKLLLVAFVGSAFVVGTFQAMFDSKSPASHAQAASSPVAQKVVKVPGPTKKITRTVVRKINVPGPTVTVNSPDKNCRMLMSYTRELYKAERAFSDAYADYAAITSDMQVQIADKNAIGISDDNHKIFEQQEKVADASENMYTITDEMSHYKGACK